MRFRDNVIREYVGLAPCALAFERVLESRIYPTVPFSRPILDLGCGDGLFAHVVFVERIDTGIDPAARELERARQLNAYDELLECRGDAIPKPAGSYRTVFSNSVLEHIEHLQPVLKEVHRILASGGFFHFTAPSRNFERFNWTSLLLSGIGLRRFDERWRRFFNRFWAHYHTYELQHWESLCQAAGFEVVHSRTFAPRRSCLLNSTLTPLGFPAKLLKSALNRWTLFPSLRRILLYPVYRGAEHVLRHGEKTVDGGLVFLSLRKK